MRLEPIATPALDSASAGRGGAGRGGRGGGRGGRGGSAVPGVPQPVPTAYRPENPCVVASDSAAPGRGGPGGGFGGGGLGGPGPYVMPGTYTVSLTSGTKVLDSKPLKLVFDPDVHFAPGEHERYTAVVTDLHGLQRRGVAAATALNELYPRLSAAAKQLSGKSDVPADVKTQFDALQKQFDAVRKKFGVPIQVGAGGRGGGGGGRGAAADPENVLARTTTLKTQLVGVWEAPSASAMRQYNEARIDLPKAVLEANAVLGRAASMSNTLKKYDVSLEVPPAVK